MLSEVEILRKYLDENPSINNLLFKWYSSNPFPWPPYFALPDPRKPSNMWPGTNPDIGSKFLKFNRKLVRDFEYWRDKNKFNKLLSWNPVTRIPGKLTYSKRINDYPKFSVEPWLTKSGSKNKEPATLSRKLSDFSNVNQLGIVIFWWNYAVYESLWGYMSTSRNVLRDPVFWKFSKFTDNIFKSWQKITDNHSIDESLSEHDEITSKVVRLRATSIFLKTITECTQEIDI